jgi:hypothetical protein
MESGAASTRSRGSERFLADRSTSTAGAGAFCVARAEGFFAAGLPAVVRFAYAVPSGWSAGPSRLARISGT